MAFLNDEIYDQALDYLIAQAADLHVCSQEPVSYAEATSTYTLGNDNGNFAIDANPSDADTGTGRHATIAALTGAGVGTVTATGTATHWAITDGTSVLLATGSLSASQALTSGNDLELSAFDVIIRDAT